MPGLRSEAAWETRYRSHASAIWSGEPNPVLVAEAGRGPAAQACRLRLVHLSGPGDIRTKLFCGPRLADGAFVSPLGVDFATGAKVSDTSS